LAAKHDYEPDEPFDLGRLSPDERRLWDEHFAGPLPENEGPAIRVWGFGHACMLFLDGPPEVVTEYLRERDPDNLIRQYQDNVRRARWSGELDSE
jgi:hypothetical protein